MNDAPCTDCIHDGEETLVDLTTIQLHDEAGVPISRRDFAKNVARFGFVLSTAVLLGIKTVNEAVAITCSCGPITYGAWYCEQAGCSGGPHNTGRARQSITRKLSQGPPPTYCGSYCTYWGPWLCNGICQKYCNGWC